MERIQVQMSLYEKLQILSDAAKYDVACTSSGVSRKGDGTGMGNCQAAGICHSFFCRWQMHFPFKNSIYK